MKTGVVVHEEVDQEALEDDLGVQEDDTGIPLFAIYDTDKTCLV